MILRAKYVLPVTQPPIEDGAVALHDGRIAAWGRAADLDGSPVRDLGEVVLCPGLINAHCHLEYTGMRGQVPYRGNFMDWLAQIVALKKTWTTEHYRQSIEHGLQQSRAVGTTNIVNAGGSGEAVNAPDVCWCAELIDLTWTEDSRRLLDAAVERLQHCDHAGLAPHALYTVSAPLYRLAARTARERGWLLTTHVAETREEDEMYRYERGPMFERYRRGARHGAVRELHGLGVLGPNCLAAHANYITADDATLLASTGTSVVHCPRTHRFFERERTPLDLWRAAGVNVCLGTDSLSSNDSLDMRAEMRELARARPDLAPSEILKMATVNPARLVGEPVTLTAVPLVGDPVESVVLAETPVIPV